jgi:hypothetical protein
MNIKFCLILGKNASGIYAMLPEAYGGECGVFLSDINGTKMVARNEGKIAY